MLVLQQSQLLPGGSCTVMKAQGLPSTSWWVFNTLLFVYLSYKWCICGAWSYNGLLRRISASQRPCQTLVRFYVSLSSLSVSLHAVQRGQRGLWWDPLRGVWGRSPDDHGSVRVGHHRDVQRSEQVWLHCDLRLPAKHLPRHSYWTTTDNILPSGVSSYIKGTVCSI